MNVFFFWSKILSLISGQGPTLEGTGRTCGRHCSSVLCGGSGRWSSRLVAELGLALSSAPWPWQAGGRLGDSPSVPVTRGKNNQGRTAASLSATKREIKLTSPPAKTCSLGPLAPATNCSTSACQSNLNACDSPQRGFILTSSSAAEENSQAGVSGRGGELCGGPGRGWGPGLLPLQVDGLGGPLLLISFNN